MNLIENFLNNSSFFLLLCSMLFYWIRAFFNISFFSYSGKLAIIGANLTMLFLLIYRGLGMIYWLKPIQAIHRSLKLPPSLLEAWVKAGKTSARGNGQALAGDHQRVKVMQYFKFNSRFNECFKNFNKHLILMLLNKQLSKSSIL